MSTNSKISNFVENQFPSFIRDDGPNFVAFVKAYYQWMEQANNAIEVSKNLLTYQDIDTTYDKYLEYFHREIIGSIPRSILSDKQKLIKHIKDVYRSRGSELSYQLLFRLLYNEEITFYYPGQDILRASDGRWVQENSIRISAPRTATAAQLENKNIVGLTSGAIARVDKVIQTTSGGILVDELFLLDIIGTFEDGERVALSTDSSVYASVFSISGPLQGVNIISGGAFHQIDDVLVYTSASGAGANGAVLEVSGSSAAQWYIANGGSGYTTGASITINDGPTGTGTSFIISAISDTEDLNINIDRILPMANVIINTGPTFVSLGANTSAVSANLASANVSTPLNAALNFANLTVGTISSITTTSYGTGYSVLPTANVVEILVAGNGFDDGAGGIKGKNATILANNAPGAIVSASVVNFGTDYSKYDTVTATNLTRSGTGAALADPSVSGIIEYSGKYIDTKGWLSYNNKLQDNYYYQEFSYEIQSNQFTNTYRQIVKDVVHPGGTIMFGKIKSFADVNVTIPTVDSETTMSDRLNIEYETLATTTTPTVNSLMRILTLGTGTIIATNSSYNIAANTGTAFTSEISGNTEIIIIGTTTNGLYFANTVANNTFMTLHSAYEQSTNTGAVFYYVSNTSA